MEGEERGREACEQGIDRYKYMKNIKWHCSVCTRVVASCSARYRNKHASAHMHSSPSCILVCPYCTCTSTGTGLSNSPLA